jgi:hypothetical protein
VLSNRLRQVLRWLCSAHPRTNESPSRLATHPLGHIFSGACLAAIEHQQAGARFVSRRRRRSVVTMTLANVVSFNGTHSDDRV